MPERIVSWLPGFGLQTLDRVRFGAALPMTAGTTSTGVRVARAFLPLVAASVSEWRVISVA